MAADIGGVGLQSRCEASRRPDQTVRLSDYLGLPASQRPILRTLHAARKSGDIVILPMPIMQRRPSLRADCMPFRAFKKNVRTF